MPIELRLWRSFLKLSEELNFRRAAQRLNVSQPALTKQIKELEERLDVSLFERESRGVALTEAGEKIVQEVSELLAAADQLERHAREHQADSAESVRLGVLEYVGRNLLPSALASARVLQPDLNNVIVQDMTLAAAATAAADGTIDLGLTMAPVKEQTLVAKALLRGRWMMVAPSDHPLATNATVHVSDLTGEPLVLFARRLAPDLYDGLIAQLDRDATGYHISYHAQDPSTGLQMAQNGVGLFIAGSYVLPDLPTGLSMNPVIDLGFPLELCLVWRRDKMRSSVRALVDGFVEAASWSTDTD